MKYSGQRKRPCKSDNSHKGIDKTILGFIVTDWRKKVKRRFHISRSIVDGVKFCGCIIVALGFPSLMELVL